MRRMEEEKHQHLGSQNSGEGGRGQERQGRKPQLRRKRRREKKEKQIEEQREEGKGFALLRGKGFAVHPAVAEEKEVEVKGFALHPAVAEKEDKEEAAGHTAGVLEEEQCVEESEDGPMRAGAPDPGARELARMTMRL